MLINLPLTAHNIKKYTKKKSKRKMTKYHLYRVTDRSHMYDATEIFRTLSKHKKESFIKLGFYAVVKYTFFFFSP